MSKLDSLVSVMERAEKQALALFLVGESKQNDSTALSMLRKRGIPEPEQVLELLKQITVDGTENGQPVWSLSNTGKEIQPLAGWFCSTWNEGDDLVQARERVADTVHKMFQIPSARNADLTKVWLKNKDLDAFNSWLDSVYEKDKAKGKIVDAEEGEAVDVGAYEFPKKMLAYSDKYVDCYRADTPADAMLLGDGYPFCISRRDGSNMFYSYRMNPTTTAYFCWFKDENGNKTKKNMVVVHVGEDGRYMVTKAENGNFPRDSKATTIKKYPKLKGAINSGKLVVKPVTDIENEVRNKGFYFRSKVSLSDIEGKTPEYIELVLSLGVELLDGAFDYIFNTIDKGNLRTGNNGNSLIKKYIESGIHELTEHQCRVLKDSGYENEFIRACEVFARNNIVAGNVPLGDIVFETVFKYVDDNKLEKGGLIYDYLFRGKWRMSAKQYDVLEKAGYGKEAFLFSRKFLGNKFGCSIRVLKNRIDITVNKWSFHLDGLIQEGLDFFNKFNLPLHIKSSASLPEYNMSLDPFKGLKNKITFAEFKGVCDNISLYYEKGKNDRLLDLPKRINKMTILLGCDSDLKGIPEFKSPKIIIRTSWGDNNRLLKGLNLNLADTELTIDRVKFNSLSDLHLPKRMEYLKLYCCKYKTLKGISDEIDTFYIDAIASTKIDYLPKKVKYLYLTCYENTLLADPSDIEIQSVSGSKIGDSAWLARYIADSNYQGKFMVAKYSVDNDRIEVENTESKYVVTIKDKSNVLPFYGKADKPIIFSEKSVVRSVSTPIGNTFEIKVEGLPENTDKLFLGGWGVSLGELPKSIKEVRVNTVVRNIEELLKLPYLEKVDFSDNGNGTSYIHLPYDTQKKLEKEYVKVWVALVDRGVKCTATYYVQSFLIRNNVETNESLSLYSLSMALDNLMD